MKSLKTVSIILLALATQNSFAAPCPTSIAGSCSFPADQTACLDAVSGAIQMSAFQQDCTSDENAGLFSTSPCNTSGLVGSCLIQNALLIRMYTPYTPEYVNLVCGQSQGVVCE